MTVANRVKLARDVRGLSRYALAGETGLSNSYFYHLEHGKIESPTIGTLRLIADALGVSFDWLAFGKGKSPRKESAA